MMMKFSDGVCLDTSGEFRTLELADGLYVVGQGFLIPVDSHEEADETIREFRKGRET